MNEKKDLLKLIGKRLIHIGIIICFVLITSFFVLVSQEQQGPKNASNEIQESKSEPSKTKNTTATLLQSNITSGNSSIELPENNSIFNKSTIVQLLSEITPELPATEQHDKNPKLDKAAFALLQNNPTLGKPSIEESDIEVALEVSKESEVTSESIMDDSSSEQLDGELTIENSSSEDSQSDSEADSSITTQQTSFPYSEKLPIPYEHQEFLYAQCVHYGLDYEKVLAVMEHESKFDPNAIGATSDYGYFQINSINHQWLSETLGTPNAPLDPYVNIQWGTFFISHLLDYWKKEGLTGATLENAVLSSYNKGITGYRRNGLATNYVEKVRESYKLIQNEYMANL